MEDAELTSRCKAGERQAWDLLYQQYRPKLLNICRQYTKENSVAEDLLHDAFVIILTSLDKLENPDKLEPWMASIVRNVGYHYRQHTNQEQTALQQMAQEQMAAADNALTPDYEQLQALVAQLPQGYQQVFRLSVFEGLSHQDISQHLGIAPHSSSSQLFHAKQILRHLIKQSWVLILLLIAIPTALWKLMHKQVPSRQLPVASKSKPEPRPAPPVEKADEPPVYASVSRKPSSVHIRYQTEATIQPDSIPYQISEQNPVDSAQSIGKVVQTDSFGKQTTPQLTIEERVMSKSVPVRRSWNVSLAYNGLTGRNDVTLQHNEIHTPVTTTPPVTISNNSWGAGSNAFISVDRPLSNWIDYQDYLNNTSSITYDPETRSLMNIAEKNAIVNNGILEARHEHRPPVSIQLLLSRQMTRHLSIETGVSYTQLSSTITTGSALAFIEERQRLRYLGVPLRLGWQWYSKAHLSLYSSAGAMLELPIHGTVDINHNIDNRETLHKETSLDVPHQWSAAFGLGLQYDPVHHLGLYIEPSLQYFFRDGSDIESYRTEHPLQVTLPFGVRFHW